MRWGHFTGFWRQWNYPQRSGTRPAEVYELNIAPHNPASQLASFQSVHLCAAVSNVRIMESDPERVPWRDELVTNVPEIIDGYMTVPTTPGWGCDLNEGAVRKYAWKR